MNYCPNCGVGVESAKPADLPWGERVKQSLDESLPELFSAILHVSEVLDNAEFRALATEFTNGQFGTKSNPGEGFRAASKSVDEAYRKAAELDYKSIPPSLNAANRVLRAMYLTLLIMSPGTHIKVVQKDLINRSKQAIELAKKADPKLQSGSLEQQARKLAKSTAVTKSITEQVAKHE